MAEYCISCCSTADLTKEYFDKRGIRYVCFHYELGGTDYLDDPGQTMPPAELYRRMLAGEDVKTSQVSIGEYADFFRKIFDEGKDILHLTLSSGISGSYNSACIAAGKRRISKQKNLCSGFIGSFLWLWFVSRYSGRQKRCRREYR